MSSDGGRGDRFLGGGVEEEEEVQILSLAMLCGLLEATYGVTALTAVCCGLEAPQSAWV